MLLGIALFLVIGINLLGTAASTSAVKFIDFKSYCEILTVIVRPLNQLFYVYPSVESKSGCKVIPCALNATIDTTSEKVRANVDASRFTSKSVSCRKILSGTKTRPSLPSDTTDASVMIIGFISSSSPPHLSSFGLDFNSDLLNLVFDEPIIVEL